MGKKLTREAEMMMNSWWMGFFYFPAGGGRGPVHRPPKRSCISRPERVVQACQESSDQDFKC